MIENLAGMLPDVLAKSVVTMLVAWAIVALMSRRSAAERHRVWVLALAALLAIPLPGAVAPHMTVPVANADAIVSFARALQRVPVIQATSPAAESALRRQAPPAPRGDRTAPGGQAGDAEPAAARAAGAESPRAVAQSLLVLWLLGSAALLARYAALRARVRRHLRTLPMLDDARVTARLRETGEAVGVDRPVTLLASELDRSPWTWGWRQPRLVVPADFAAWGEAAQRQVLMHELAHVRRRDHLIGILAQICCAAYWFNPLVWLGAAGIRLEAEKACDDRVLTSGEPAPAYAGQLLQIANSIFSERSRSVWIPAMAHRSSLSPRVRSILDPNNRRHAMSQSKSYLFLAAALVLAVPLAAIRSTSSVAQEPTAALSETELLQLVQRGPAGSDELETIVEYHVASGRPEAAAEALAGFMMREYGTPDGERCDYCIEILASEGTPRQHERFGIIVDALELIEQRAEQDQSGNVLIDTVMANALGSGNRNATARAAYYVMRAVQLGIDDSRNLGVARFLYEQGNAAESLELARRLHDTEGSAHYQSPEAAQWIRYLEGELRRRETLTRLIVDSLAGGSATIDGDYLPITKTAPVYPTAAAEQRLEGHVVVEFTVDTDGKPLGVTVVESSDSVFNDSALTAAREFRYAPRLVAGTPVAVPGVRNRIVYRLE